jgi:hypothetical protein
MTKISMRSNNVEINYTDMENLIFSSVSHIIECEKFNAIFIVNSLIML